MKKGRIALIALLALCMALVLSILPMSVFAVDATDTTALVGTKLTTSHAGKTLSGDYYVEPGTTLTLRGGTGVSGVKVDANKTLTIHIPANSVLYVYGGAASGTTGAGAGIEVNSGSTLKVTGAGKLYTYGGKAANGSSGGNGENANWVDDGRSYIPDGGYGGSGGGGAGAGIGTKGGNGGSGAGWTRGFGGGLYKDTESFVDINYSGPTGGNGGSGSSASSCGAIYISADITYTANGGAAGTSGGSGGSRGSSDYESDNHWMRGMAGGAGGGGGGAGKAGANVGTGGGGGGGGGAGGGVGYAWSYRFLGAGGGGGGAGAVGGSGGAWAQDGEVPDCKKFQYFGGVERYSSSGSSGSTSSGGSGGKGAKVKITDWDGDIWQYPYGGYGGSGGSAGSNCSTVSVQKLYDVTISVEEELIGSYYASANEFLPENLGVPSKDGYTFEGFYAGDVQYYDVDGARTSAAITADTDISAKFTVNSYDFEIESNGESTGGGTNETGSVNYGDSITLATPQREGYLFRGWKISATNGSINPKAYYTYTSATPMARNLRSTGQVSEYLIHDGEVAMTEGFEKIGSSITLYNLSADANAKLKFQEIWAEDNFTVTFKDFDGTIISVEEGIYGDVFTVPGLPDHQNEYYTYRFKYWKCNIDGEYYSSEELPFIGGFVSLDREKGEMVYDEVIFTAVYDIVEYKKELHFVGSLGNTNLDNGTLVLNSNDTNVDVVTNFRIKKNDGVAAMLLIPEYDRDAFSIKAISVNGQLVSGATSSMVLDGFNVEITGDETDSDYIKILLDNITPDNSTSDDIFIQIVYVMKTAIGGEYEFGFVTKTPSDTDSATHGDRSEAYGTYDPDANSAADAWRFNELNVTVDNTAIKVVIRATGEITIAPNQSFTYNGQQMSAAEVTEMIEKVLQYTYNGVDKKNPDTLTIKWYDEQGNELPGAPKNAGTYKIGISAAETIYYTAVEEVIETFTITPYNIYVVAGSQSFEYIGNNIVIDRSSSNGNLFIMDAEGNMIPVDAFVNSEIILAGVELLSTYTDAGTYKNAIQGIIQYIGNGSAANYNVIYQNGTLTVTKAENDWSTVPSDKTVEYSGNSVSIDNVSADFGEVNIKYLIDYQKDASGNYVIENGERVPIWSETPPTNAGTYPVKVTVTGNDNYSGLEYEVTLVITKKVISAGDFTFDANDKVYNGESQYWSLDPDDNVNTNDAEVWLIASGANSSILEYVKFAGMLHPVDCTNAGTYTIQAMLQIINPNYTFVLKGEEVDSWTYDVEVNILQLNIVVNADNQSAEYSGTTPNVNQGRDYFTITLEDGTAAPEFIIRDFFGGIRELYVIANDYVDGTTYYQLVNGNYQAVSLTKDQFNANKEISGEEDYIEYYTKVTIMPEELVLSTDGIKVGTYDLIATLGNNSNYRIVSYSGTFTITKKLIPVPSLGILIYNGQTQCPEIPEEYRGIYEFVGGGKDVGIHLLKAVLLDKENYAWENVISIDVADLPTNKSFTVQIAGRTLILYIGDIDSYETINFMISAGMYTNTTIPMTSEDIILPWYIDPKKLVLVFSDATEEYVYGTFGGDIESALGAPCWKDGVGPYDGDEMTDIHWLNYGYGAYPTVGTHYISVSQGMFNTNYEVIVEGGKVEIFKKTLTKEDIEDQINAVIKYYTGEELVLDTWDDFEISLFDYNNKNQKVFYVTGVNTNGHVNANGLMNEDNFVYYIDDETGKIYVTVTVSLTEEVKANYELADVEEFTFEVEAYIAKAENRWTSVPEVDSSIINDVKTYADALFGDVEGVQFFEDEECTVSISIENLKANQTYYAKFTVAGGDNYYGLEKIVVFSGNYITIVKPIITLDSETGESVEAGKEIIIIYDGKAHVFIYPTGEGYTVTLSPSDEWKNIGTYTVTISLTDDNYAWEDGTQNELTYTLRINKKDLTITADNKEITFGDDAPEYTVTTNGLVEGEALADLLGGAIEDYINCGYSKGDKVDIYDINLLDAIADKLKNYDITLVDGKLTVKKLVFGYDDITSSDENTFEDLIENGPDFIYDSEGKEVKVENLPNELEVVITYKDKNGNVVSYPTDAGEYTVEITVKVKDGYDAGNYDIPDKAEIILTIEKASITITVEDQEYVYDGNDQVSKIPAGSYTITVNNGQVLTDSVVLTVSGEYIDAGIYADTLSATHSYDTNNYVVTIINGDLTIKKADNAWTEQLKVDQNIAYGDSSVVNGTYFSSDPEFGDNYITYTFYKKSGDSWHQLDAAPTNAGEYAVIASIPGTNNYGALVSERIEFAIRKATITLNGIIFEDATVIYNGQAHSIYVTDSEISSLFSIGYQGNGKVNAGIYTVTATFVLADSNNYEFEGTNTLDATLTVERVKVTINANNNTSMYGNAINQLTYGIEFVGNQNYLDFYANEFGSISLNTSATNLSNVGEYPIYLWYNANSNYDVTANNGVYTITKFIGNEIDLTARDVNYLMDLIYSATALRGEETIKFTFATSENGTYTSELPKNVGTYYVKATIVDTDNYEGAEKVVSFQITKATLSSITDITYNADTATWTAVVTTTDGKRIDCDVTYLVDGNSLTAARFTANKAGSFTVTAIPADMHNYNSSAEVTLANVYSVSFEDTVDNHEKQQILADLTGDAFATQYRFEGQAVTRPDGTPTVVGYTFRAWQLNDSDYGFSEGVYDNITLYAAWTINTYTLNFYNELVTGSNVVNGVFHEGIISTEYYTTYTVTYGSPFNLSGVTNPTKAGDAVYTYSFAYWSDALRGNDIGNIIYVYDDMDLYAVYLKLAKQFTITYMVSVDGGQYEQHNVVTLPYGSPLITLDDVAWFAGDIWYMDADRSMSAPEFIPAEDMTLYGAYVFDIGAGDVNASGVVSADDIVIYRQWIVGGYNIIKVEEGKEWALVKSGAYDSSARYYIARVADANRDASNDIRDIATIRMALTGGYGYDIVTGTDVTGEAVILALDAVPGIPTPESLQATLDGAIGDEIYIKLTKDITLTETLVLDSGKKVTINLNGYTLTLPSDNKYGVAVKNGTLIIEGEGKVIVPGLYGFGTASDTTTGHIVINGGTFIGEDTEYLFGCYNGSITINGGSFKARCCIINNFADDGYHTMSGVATVNGGSFEVTDTDTYYRSFMFFDVDINGTPSYRVRTAENLAIALAGGGTVTLVGDVTVDDAALSIYVPYYTGYEYLCIPSGKTVSLDLNGYSIKQEKECTGSYAMITNNGSFTISDSVGGGKISFKDIGTGDASHSWGSYTILNSGTLVVNGGTIENLSEQNKDQEYCMHMFSAIDQAQGATTVNSGIVSTPYYRSVRIRSGALTITDGVFDGQIWLQTNKQSNISLNISGGEFSPNWEDGSSVYIENNEADCAVVISGGFFQTKISSNASYREQLAGIVVGGVFTEEAKTATPATLISESCEFVDNGDGTYTLVERSLQ